MCAFVQTEEWFTTTVDLVKPLGTDAAGRPRFRINYARRGNLPASKVYDHVIVDAHVFPAICGHINDDRGLADRCALTLSPGDCRLYAV